ADRAGHADGVRSVDMGSPELERARVPALHRGLQRDRLDERDRSPRVDRLRAATTIESRDRLRDRDALTTNIATGHLFTLRCGEVSEWLMVPLSKSGRRSEEHTSELQSRVDLVCRLLLE